MHRALPMNSGKPVSDMKLYIIAFTKNGAFLQGSVEKAVYNSYCSDFYVQKFLSARIYDELIGDDPSRIGRISLGDFCQRAWQEADAILFIGATGIAIRGIAPYVAAKDKDPAVLVMDELGRFVIPLLSGHIGGANELATMLSGELGSTVVMTTATDINHKLAIDSWAVKRGYEIGNTDGIAPVSSAVLEDREVVLIARRSDLDELGREYPNFVCCPLERGHDAGGRASKPSESKDAENPISEPIQPVIPNNPANRGNEAGTTDRMGNADEDRTRCGEEADQGEESPMICGGDAVAFRREWENPAAEELIELERRIDIIMEENLRQGKGLPIVVISPLAIKPRKGLLHIVPKRFFVGMGARRDKNSKDFMEFYHRMLKQAGIHPRSVASIASIDLKAEEHCFLELAKGEQKHTKLRLEFYTTEKLATAEQYTMHDFAPSDLVRSVTGVDNVCERAAVISAAKYFELSEGDKAIEVIVPKTRHNGMTFALARRGASTGIL